jgi:single-stranded DNA-binding protein
MNYQHITLIGRATADAKSIATDKGKEFATFSLAVNEYKGKELPAETTFYDCMIFGQKQIEAVTTKVKKGDTITLHGRPAIDAYLSNKSEAKPSVRVLVSEWMVVK